MRKYGKPDFELCDLFIDLEEVIKKSNLTEKQAESLELVYGKGKTQKEAGEYMNISQQTVNLHIKGAFKRMNKIFKSYVPTYGTITVEFDKRGEGD